MAFSLQDLMSQFGSMGGGGAQTFGAGADTMSGMTATGGLLPSGAMASFGGAGAAGGAGGLGSIGAFAANPMVGAGLMGLQALSGLIQGNKQFKLAKDQFKFQKQIANANLNNSIKSYNNSLEDRLTARGVMQGDDSAATQAEIDRKRLSR